MLHNDKALPSSSQKLFGVSVTCQIICWIIRGADICWVWYGDLMYSLLFRLQQGTGWCVDLPLNMSETALWKHYTAEPIRTHTLGDVNEFVSVLDGVESSLLTLEPWLWFGFLGGPRLGVNSWWVSMVVVLQWYGVRFCLRRNETFDLDVFMILGVGTENEKNVNAFLSTNCNETFLGWCQLHAMLIFVLFW